MEYTFTTDLLFLGLILIVPLIAQGMVSSRFAKYKKVKNKKGLTGREVAEIILKENNLENIYIVETKGNLTDHYDPKRKVVRLSKDIYNEDTIAAASIAAHEVGHAIQDKEGYVFMKIRSAIFPVVNIGTSLSYIILIIGIIAQAINLIWLGIALTALGLVFQLITLPVEFDASSKAKKELLKLKLIGKNEYDGVAKMLGAAAMTYVAGVLASALQIIRLVLLYGRGND